MSNESIELPANLVKYFCSVCDAELSSHAGVKRHISRNGGNNECAAAGAEVRMIATREAVEEAIETAVSGGGSGEDQGAEVSDPFAPPSSMAEQAGMGNIPPPWFPNLDEEEPDDDDEPDRQIEPFHLRNVQAGLAINPAAWLVVAYEAALRDGYVGTCSDWVHDEIEYLFVLTGVKIELLAVSDTQRQILLERAGLAYASN